jgi:dTDP-4-amino-4,6-dideoxygalactose transaminase
MSDELSHRYNYAAQFGENIDQLMLDLRSMLLEGRYILAPEVKRFEQVFAEYTGCSFARGLNSGTDAIMIALLAIGLQPEEEVITQANTFHATVSAIQMVGARPVLVDADDRSFLMDVRQVSPAITPRTRVLMPVHLFGKPTPMVELMAVAAAHRAQVVEDAAQAHGAMIHGKRVGGFGIAGCFSFHPSKNLAAAGDAGAIVTNDAGLVSRIECFRALGQREQGEHVVVGLNSKLDAIQARILSSKIASLDAWNCARAQVASWYRESLIDLPLVFQRIDDGERHVYHLLQVRTHLRDKLLSYLQSHGVDAVVRYPTPIHLQPAFAKWGWRRGQFPVAERLASELLCLPIRPDMQRSEVEAVALCIHNFFAHAYAAASRAG